MSMREAPLARDMSKLSATDLQIGEQAARAALVEAAREWGKEALGAIGPDHDLFEEIDSLAVVDLLLLTESEVEARTGRFIPLADETIFDAEDSPLHRFSTWVEYVSKAISHG